MATEMIMKILNAKIYSDIFKGAGESEIKKEFKEMAMIAHPDKGGNTDLMTKLNIMYELALDSMGNSKRAVQSSNEIELISTTGKSVIYKYREMVEFELGKILIGKSHVTYLVDMEFEDLFKNAIKRIKEIKYPTKEMEEINSKYFPTINKTFQTKDYFVLEVLKTEDVHRLSLVKDFVGKFDIKHTAWVTTRLSNIACALEFSGLVHNGISLDNCFISPQHHSIMLLGGWWYCTKQGEKMIGTVEDVYNVMDVDTKTTKISTNKTDLDSIKEIGRRLNGGSMVYIKSNEADLPKSIANWFIKASEKSNIKEYEAWEKALVEGFGQRKFIKFDISEDDMYTTRRK